MTDFSSRWALLAPVGAVAAVGAVIALLFRAWKDRVNSPKRKIVAAIVSLAIDHAVPLAMVVALGLPSVVVVLFLAAFLANLLSGRFCEDCGTSVYQALLERKRICAKCGGPLRAPWRLWRPIDPIEEARYKSATERGDSARRLNGAPASSGGVTDPPNSQTAWPPINWP